VVLAAAGSDDQLRRDQQVRSPANCTTGVAAFMAARGGSLCVRTSRPPPDYASVASLLRAVDAGVQLIVCADQDSQHDVLLTVPMPIVIPALGARAAEVPRIVDEYAADALALLKVRDPCFADEDRAWLLALESLSLAEIEKATLRLIAVRASTSVSSAAARLGMAPVSLSRWLARRTCTPGRRSGDRTRSRPPA
jgi:hypothetical protein